MPDILPGFKLIVEKRKEEKEKMEMALTILMALGIYVGVPVVVGLAIATGYVVTDRRTQKVAHVARKEAKAYTETF